MFLQPWENRVGGDFVVQVSRKHVFDQSGYFDMFRGYHWKFDPILQNCIIKN